MSSWLTVVTEQNRTEQKPLLSDQKAQNGKEMEKELGQLYLWRNVHSPGNKDYLSCLFPPLSYSSVIDITLFCSRQVQPDADGSLLRDMEENEVEQKEEEKKEKEKLGRLQFKLDYDFNSTNVSMPLPKCNTVCMSLCCRY